MCEWVLLSHGEGVIEHLQKHLLLVVVPWQASTLIIFALRNVKIFTQIFFLEKKRKFVKEN
jgi:hypothetical protein